MRWIGGIMMLLLAVGWIVAEVPGPASPRCQLAHTDWRWTRDGWVRPTWLDGHIPVRQPALHPAVVGAFQLLVAVAALVALPAARRQRRAPVTRAATPGHPTAVTRPAWARRSPWPEEPLPNDALSPAFSHPSFEATPIDRGRDCRIPPDRRNF